MPIYAGSNPIVAVRRGSGVVDNVRLGGNQPLFSNCPKLSAPATISATAGNAQADVTWAAVTGAGHYSLQYRAVGSSEWITVDLASVISISSQPANQTAASGAATFSVTATVTNGATLSYQWQKQEGGAGAFANVAGATSATLSLTGLTNAADNGDVYRVVVSATGGAASVTSSTATLTVAPAGDPLWSSVGLLVPFDTNTTDVKSGIVPIPHDVAPNIAATGKFGSYASYGEVSGNTAAANGLGLKYAVPAPGTGDFTVEFWLRGQSFADGFGFGGQFYRILLLGHQYGEGPHLNIWAKSGLGLTVGITSVSYSTTPIGGDITVASGSWHHLAAVRQGGTLRVYSNGIQTGTLSDSRNIPDGWLIVGSFTDGTSARMGVDDLRYTRSCRYPDGTTFTPPTAAFPTN